MSNICRFTAPASRDIESIIDLIADNSSFNAAERFLNKINDIAIRSEVKSDRMSTECSLRII